MALPHTDSPTQCDLRAHWLPAVPGSERAGFCLSCPAHQEQGLVPKPRLPFSAPCIGDDFLRPEIIPPAKALCWDWEGSRVRGTLRLSPSLSASTPIFSNRQAEAKLWALEALPMASLDTAGLTKSWGSCGRESSPPFLPQNPDTLRLGPPQPSYFREVPLQKA